MSISKYEPWNVMSHLQGEINRIFSNADTANASSSATADWSPPVDIHEYADRFEIFVDVPGVEPKAVEITLDNGVLTLSGERAMAQRARGFDMTVLYHSRNRLPADLERGAQYFASFHDMLPHCDFLSLHAPATPATDRIINAETLALLPRGAVLVNVARGGLVDEDALHAALTSGQLFAAGLDVFRTEPDFDTRFAALPNVILSPHIGSGSVETRNAMGFRALDNIAAVLAGKGPIDPLWV